MYFINKTINMKNKIFAILTLLIVSFGICLAQSNTKNQSISGVAFNKVSLNDQFWLPKIEINRTVTIPASFKKCEETGRVENFVLAAEKRGKLQSTYPFDDTDVYKIIEGASYSMN